VAQVDMEKQILPVCPFDCRFYLEAVLSIYKSSGYLEELIAGDPPTANQARRLLSFKGEERIVQLSQFEAFDIFRGQ
jgi:hypothetical protein